MEEKITSEVKTKDPRRVEAGKRLAAISKAAKEKKMRERLSLESAASGTNYITYLIPTFVAVVAATSLYFYYHRDTREDKITELRKKEIEIDLTPKKDTLDKL